MSYIRLDVILLVALSLGYAASARSDTVKFCFRSTGDFHDNGHSLNDGTKEDYWTGDENKLVRGARIKVRNKQLIFGQFFWVTGFDGFLGDGLGSGDPGIACTPLMTVPNASSDYWVTIESGGEVNSNTIYVKDWIGGSSGSLGDVAVTSVFFSHTKGSSANPFYVDFVAGTDAERKRWRGYAVSAYAFYRHNGGNALHDWQVVVNGYKNEFFTHYIWCASDGGSAINGEV